MSDETLDKSAIDQARYNLAGLAKAAQEFLSPEDNVMGTFPEDPQKRAKIIQALQLPSDASDGDIYRRYMTARRMQLTLELGLSHEATWAQIEEAREKQKQTASTPLTE